MNPIVAWLTALALQLCPPAHAHQFPGHIETVEQATARYQSIAEDIYTVVDKASTKMFSKQRNAGFLLALAIGETELAHDADLGPCYREGAHKHRCDGGRAVGILQVQPGSPERIKELFADRKALLTVGLRAVVSSLGTCRHLPFDERLAAYGAGNCENARARAGSKKRFATFERVMSLRAVPKDWPKAPPPPAPEPKKDEPAPKPEKVAAK